MKRLSVWLLLCCLAPVAQAFDLQQLSDQLARRIADTLSREAGLYTAHEMMEALDPNHHSEIAESLMAECERLLDDSPQP